MAKAVGTPVPLATGDRLEAIARDDSLPTGVSMRAATLAARRARLIGWSLSVVGGIALLLLFYSLAFHVFEGNSDGATVILEGQAMAHGHLLLHGWSLSLDSFWTIDALFAMIAVGIAGVRPELLHLIPAVIAVLTIGVGAYLARDGRKGLPAGCAVLVVVALLGLASPDLAYVLLRSDWHVGTALWCLLAFALLRSGRFGRAWLLGVVILAAGILGDFQIVVFGVLPLFVAGLCAMVRRRAWRAGAAACVGAVASLAVAGLVRAIADVIGTFAVVGAKPIAHLPQMWANVGRIFTRGAALLGVGNAPVGRSNGAVYLQDTHVVGLLVIVGGLLVALAGLVTGLVRGSPASVGSVEPWRLDDLLVLGVLADGALFVLLSLTGNGNYARQLTPGVIFAVILAGRAVAALAERLGRGVVARSLALVGCVVVALFAVDFAGDFVRPNPVQPATELSAFLAAHQLKQGIGDYWSSSIVTVESRGAVAVRPVVMSPQGRLVRYAKQSTSAWYAGQRFQFMVFNTARPWGHVNAAAATHTFGPPKRTYVVGTFRVLVWSHGLTVSPVGATWY